MTADYYEYTQMPCDAWQMHHAASEMGYQGGWEAIGAVNLNQGFKVPSDIRAAVKDVDGTEYEAVCPVAVLFRRPIPTGMDE